jgi:hypothetical protein
MKIEKTTDKVPGKSSVIGRNCFEAVTFDINVGQRCFEMVRAELIHRPVFYLKLNSSS